MAVGELGVAVERIKGPERTMSRMMARRGIQSVLSPWIKWPMTS
jgi:hypothetical protein